jgi:flagellar hook-length control protein FliK
VHLDVDKNGQLTSHLTVERADTLDMLRRDSAGLERTLQDAGLKTSNNGLQFSLRDQSTSQQQSNAPNPAAA